MPLLYASASETTCWFSRQPGEMGKGQGDVGGNNFHFTRSKPKPWPSLRTRLKDSPSVPIPPRSEKCKSSIPKLECTAGLHRNGTCFGQWQRQQHLVQISGYMAPLSQPKGCSELEVPQGMACTRIYGHWICAQKWSSWFCWSFAAKSAWPRDLVSKCSTQGLTLYQKLQSDWKQNLSQKHQITVAVSSVVIRRKKK